MSEFLASLHPILVCLIVCAAKIVEITIQSLKTCMMVRGQRLKAAGLEVVTHIIIGLPGEDGAMAVQTTRAAVQAGTDGVKFHLLHVLRGTDLAQDYTAGKFRCLTLEEYGSILKRCIAQLPEDTVIHRITGDGAKRDLIAPLWSGDKKRVLNYLHSVLDIPR